VGGGVLFSSKTDRQDKKQNSDKKEPKYGLGNGVKEKIADPEHIEKGDNYNFTNEGAA
jgi:hypothetical protein